MFNNQQLRSELALANLRNKVLTAYLHDCIAEKQIPEPTLVWSISKHAGEALLMDQEQTLNERSFERSNNLIKTPLS